MARRKGDGLGRVGGRKKGTPNKVTAEFREMIKKFATENYKNFIDDWTKITDKEKKCRLYIEMVKFVLPSLSSVSLENNVKVDTTVSRIRQMRDDIEENKAKKDTGD